MAIWPSTLYSCILKDGYQEITPENTIRSAMGYGPAKVRQRASSNVRDVTMSLFCSDAQLATFETFYTSTVKYGSIQFGMFKPRYAHDTTSGQYRFVGQPAYANFNQGWRITMKLEELP